MCLEEPPHRIGRGASGAYIDGVFASDLRANLPSYGPGWEAAIDYGIDVSLLLRNLELTPTERLMALQKWLAFCEDIRGKAHEHSAPAR